MRPTLYQLSQPSHVYVSAQFFSSFNLTLPTLILAHKGAAEVREHPRLLGSTAAVQETIFQQVDHHVDLTMLVLLYRIP
jgi:hypothetical protein